jgi:hypothetical protein
LAQVRDKKYWRFSALIEHGAKRILFYTGDDTDILANNATARHTELPKLDLVVLSHRHLVSQTQRFSATIESAAKEDTRGPNAG